jgi:hypothetical protein
LQSCSLSWQPLAASQLSVALTLRTIDSNQVALPADLQGRAFNDPAVISRFQALLTALAPKLNTVKWVNLANEVDLYFTQKENILTAPAFLQLFSAGASALKAAIPGVSIGMVFSYSGYWYTNQTFSLLNAACDHIAFSYYPIRTDFTVRDASIVSSDFAEMVWAAGSKPLIFTELGYPSSPVIGSSTLKQQAFYSNVFDYVQAHSGNIAAGSFFQMMDLSKATVDSLVQYYNTGNNAGFGAFLGSLGTMDSTGIPKLSWTTFASRTTSFLAPVCTLQMQP